MVPLFAFSQSANVWTRRGACPPLEIVIVSRVPRHFNNKLNSFVAPLVVIVAALLSVSFKVIGFFFSFPPFCCATFAHRTVKSYKKRRRRRRWRRWRGEKDDMAVARRRGPYRRCASVTNHLVITSGRQLQSLR